MSGMPAVVSGGASGLGMAVVERLSLLGANVTIFDLNEIEGEKIKTEETESLCKHSTQMEILATKAERVSIKLMQIKFMKDKEGKTFDAVISGVVARGVFVEVVENKCEGLVKVKDLPGDFFVHDQKNHRFVGEKTGKKFQLGDKTRVMLIKADQIKKRLDFQVLT